MRRVAALSFAHLGRVRVGAMTRERREERALGEVKAARGKVEE